MAFVETNDITKPAGSRARSLGDDDIREFKRLEIERQAVDHDRRDIEVSDPEKSVTPDATGDGHIGQHKKVTLITRTGDQTAVANTGILYTKDVSGVAELFFVDENDNVIQITSGGKILGTYLLLENNSYLKAKDAAGTGTVDLIKANASDKAQLPDGAVMATSAAPTVDAGIANKKYVDDFTPATPAASKGLRLDVDTAIPASQDILKNLISVQQANGTTDINVSGALVAMTNMSLEVVVATGDIVVLDFSCVTEYGGASGGGPLFQLLRDSTELQKASELSESGGYPRQTHMQYVDTPSAGTYTYSVKWGTSGGGRQDNLPATDYHHRNLRIIKIKA